MKKPLARRSSVVLAKSVAVIVMAILISGALPGFQVRAYGSPFGDTYSFEHQLGALIDGLFQCFSEQGSGMDDNTVLFDGLSELLDPYTNGTQPFVFEFETSNSESLGLKEFQIISMGNDDLFPEGFQDPETGTPLTDACVEIGIDDTLDSDPPADVTNATLDFLVDGTSLFGAPLDITSAFQPDPWDGRLSIVFPNFVGMDIDEVRLKLTTAPANADIFADGFESGDASSWTDQSP